MEVALKRSSHRTVATLVGGCGLATALLANLAFGAEPSSARDARPNVLFIAIDDFRPTLGCYGDQIAQTPRIDRLAGHGVVFERAYCQDSVCSPSRTSMLTGLRPDTTRIFDNGTDFRLFHPDIVTLPQQFRLQGYQSIGMGKIYHSQWDRAYVGRRLADPLSWSEPAWFPPVVRFYFTPEGERIAREVYAQTENCKLEQGGTEVHTRKQAGNDLKEIDLSDARYDQWTEHFVMGPISEAPDVPDNTLYDGQVADRAIETLRRLKEGPFFMAVGFTRPHIPYVAPKRYWDLYKREGFTPADNQYLPAGAPSWALLDNPDHDPYYGVPEGRFVDDDMARKLIHGYYACVSYVDSQVGRVLDELERLGLADNTIIVVWGDHGYHLGENGRWGKQTCFEMANRQPLIVYAPGKAGNGSKSSALVESVDLYPTLCELAGLPIPTTLEGTSMVPLLEDPARTWKAAAFSQFPRPARSSRPKVQAESDDKMGYSMRTDRYRYIEWRFVERPEVIAARELYDHQSDPMENTNLADQPAMADLVHELHEQLKTGWRGAKPPQT